MVEGLQKLKPGILRINKYAVLKCLSLSQEEMMDFETLHRCTGIEGKRLVTALGRLIDWKDIRRDKSKKPTTYTITKAGYRKLKYFERNGFEKYWHLET